MFSMLNNLKRVIIKRQAFCNIQKHYLTAVRELQLETTKLNFSTQS